MFLPKRHTSLICLFVVFAYLFISAPPARAQTPTPVPFVFGTDATTGDFVIRALGGAVKLRIDSEGNLNAPMKGFGSGGGNLVANGSFEYNTVGTGETTGTTNSWTKDFQTTCGASCTYIVEGGSFYGGAKSYSIKPSAAGPTGSVASAAFSVVPGSILKGSLDINCSADIASGITVSVIYFTGDFATTVYGSRSGAATTVYSGGCTAGTTWANKSLEFTVPSNCSAAGGGNTGTATCTRARVLIARDNTAPTATVYLDNVTVGAPGSSSSFTAANISAGAFGSSTGGGNYSFPGNVGIGTTVPAAKLDIAGVVSTISNTVGNISIIPFANLIVTQGNVGIGTTIPAQKLDVVGTVKATAYQGDGSALTGVAGTPAGAVVFFNLASCPTGWTELTAARGMYIVGLPLSGTLAGTSGTALTNLENRAVGQHLHSIDPASTGVSISDPGHRHTSWPNPGDGNGNFSGGVTFGCCMGSAQTNWTSSVGTGITASVDIAAFNSANAGSVAGTNAPYIQLLACQKS